MIRTYFAFFRMRFLALLQYRTAAAAGAMTNWAFGMMRVMVMCAFYASTSKGQPMSLAQTITYTWLSQMMLGLLPWRLDEEISNSVVSGQVAYELTRPVDIYTMWFMRTVANRLAPTIMRGVPQFIVCAFIIPAQYRMNVPGLAQWAAWLAATFGALILSAAITNFMHAYVLIMQRVDGLTRMVNSLAELLSGMIIPLALMPDAMAIFLKYQPFAGVVDLPVRLFCGSMPVGEVWKVLIMQAVWIIIFVVAGRLLTGRGLKRTVIAGG